MFSSTPRFGMALLIAAGLIWAAVLIDVQAQDAQPTQKKRQPENGKSEEQKGQTGSQGEKQNGQSGDQGEKQNGQSGDQGEKQNGQSGDQGGKQNDNKEQEKKQESGKPSTNLEIATKLVVVAAGTPFLGKRFGRP